MSKKKIWGRCRLCLSDNWLVDSDIIPKFHYKTVKEVEGRFYVLSTDPSKKVIPKQKTITEHLLCRRCDNERLSRYEKHLEEVLFGGYPLEAEHAEPVVVIKGYDYKMVKNCLLSILWRMSLSTDVFFSKVSLGDKHEERLRVTLLNDVELPEEEYPIYAVAPYFDGSNPSDVIMEPDFTRIDGNRVYRCLISGLIFAFFVGSAPLGNVEKSLILRSKCWPIGRARVEDIPFLYEAALQHGRANTARAK